MALPTLQCSIIAVGDFPEGGATSQRLYLLTRLLNEGLGDTSLWLLHPTSKVLVKENCSDSGEWNGVKFSYLNGITVRPEKIKEALIDTVKGIYKSIRLISSRGNERPDVLVIYTPNFFKFIVPVILAKFLRIPIFFEICEISSKSTALIGHGILRRFINSNELLMERLIPIVASGLLIISRRIQHYYNKLGVSDDAVYLLPALVDSERYEKGRLAVVKKLKGVQYLLNSGSYSEKDGLFFLIKAMAKVHEEYPNVKLVFTGTTNLSTQEKILKSAGSIGKNWIIFTGFLSREELIWCYKNAIGLLCCRSNSKYANYGFPTKLAEYLASGSPVIATTVGDVEKYLTDEESAFLAKPENVESIAIAIRRLISAPGRAERIGRKGSEVAHRFFDYRKHVEQVAIFIRRRIETEYVR